MRIVLGVVLLGLSACECGGGPSGQDAGDDAGLPDAAIETPDASLPGEVVLQLDAQFGPVRRGESSSRVLQLHNGRAQAVTISFQALAAPFALDDGRGVVLQPGDDAQRLVSFTPTQLGGVSARLSVSLDGAAPMALTLDGFGVGPTVELAPDALALGTLDFFDGFPVTARRTLTLENRGVAAPGVDTSLRVGFEVVALEGDASELCLDDCLGTPRRLEVGERLELPLTVTLGTAGPRSYELRVFTDDPDHALLTVPVTATAHLRPTCAFALPQRLAFGVLNPTESREREVLFENVGTEPCELTSIAVVNEAPAPTFTLPSVPVTPVTVLPGEALPLRVRASSPSALPGTGGVIASLALELNSPTSPAFVELSAQRTVSCLTLAPSPLDFGVVRPGCRSPQRTVRVFNWCGTTDVTAITSSAPGSFPVSATLPARLGPGDTFDFTVQYAPGAAREDLGAVDVVWTLGAQLVRSQLEVRGLSTSSGENVERFPPVGNRLDVLLVIADSPAMVGLASKLDAQLPRLLSQLTMNQVDFHLGVLTADGAGQGALRSLGTLRYLTNTTPQLTTQLQTFTRVGGQATSESCNEAVRRALTAPALGTTNLGFRRPGVPLSVLCITTQRDLDLPLAPDVLQVLPREATWHVLAPLTNGTCGAAYGPGHLTLTSATGGLRGELCDPSWATVLDAVANPDQGRAFFVLGGHPEQLPEVSLDGVLVAPTSQGATVWEWLTVPRDVVRFSPPFAPQPQAQVEVRWTAACNP